MYFTESINKYGRIFFLNRIFFFFFWVGVGCFFFFWVGVVLFFFFFFFFSWVGCSVFYLFIFIFILASASWVLKKKKKCTGWQVWNPWIVLKNSVMKIKVMLPNECEKLSDEWWVMNYEWWKLSDENWVMKKAYPNSP